MLKITSLLVAAAFALPLAGHAAEGNTKQQNKMASCSADFKTSGKDGKERQAFMKDCLAASKQEKQQNKMSSCSADFKATGKAGKERQAFMKECLSGSPAATADKAAPAAPAMAAAPAPAAAPAAAPKK